MMEQNIKSLTARQKEVLAEVASGKTNHEVAQALGISVATVENHLTEVYRKLYVTSRAEAIICAFRAGMAH